MVRPEFFQLQDIVIVMVGGFECSQVIFAGLGYDQYHLVAEELAEELTAPVVVKAQHIRVEPHLTSPEG